MLLWREEVIAQPRIVPFKNLSDPDLPLTRQPGGFGQLLLNPGEAAFQLGCDVIIEVAG